MTENTENSLGFRLAVVFEGGLGIVAVALAWLFGIELRKLLPATWDEGEQAAVRGLIATLPLLAGFWWLVRTPLPPLVQLRETVVKLVHEVFPGGSIPQLALVSLLAGVCEELLFRGVLQTLVERWSTPAVGLAVASLVFGSLHAITWLYFVLATLVGAYLGWLMLRFGDLAAPIVAHALYDFVALVYLTKQERRSEP